MLACKVSGLVRQWVAGYKHMLFCYVACDVTCSISDLKRFEKGHFTVGLLFWTHVVIIVK